MTFPDSHTATCGSCFFCFSQEALKVNNKLKHLCLLGNDLADKGAITLAEALPFNETLTRLNLSRNYIRRDVSGDGGRDPCCVLELNDLFSILGFILCSYSLPQGAKFLAVR